MALVIVNRCPYPRPVSVKLGEKAEVENGYLVGIGEPKFVGDQELYEGKFPDGKLQVGIIADPFHPYDKRDKEIDVVHKQGDVVRVYPQSKGDCFTIPKAAFSGAIAVNDLVKAKTGNYQLTKDAEGTSAFAKVTRIYTVNGQESVRIEFI